MVFNYLIKKKINYRSIYLSSFFYKNIFNFNILKLLWSKLKIINKRNLRQQYLPKYKSHIMGFKMIFRGRFSRKDRASKMTLVMGKVPLNTLESKIDYTFLTMPLKNSIISFKIYMYRKEFLYNYKNTVFI